MNKRKLRQLKQIEDMRREIDRLSAAGDTDGAELYKQKIHAIYNGRRVKKLVITISVLTVLAIIALIALINFISFKRTLEARGERIQKNFEGLTFFGELTTADKYVEGESDPELTYFKTYEATTLAFNEKGNIKHHWVHDVKVIHAPEPEEGKTPPHDAYSEFDSTYYTYEVFVNFKGTAFLHLQHKLFKLVLDENDVPVRIIDYNNKDLNVVK